MQLPLTLYMANELEPAEREEVERHLNGCPACREVAERLQDLTRLAAAADAGTFEEPGTVQARRRRLMAALASQTRPAIRSADALFQPHQLRPLILSFAAMLLVAFGFFLGRVSSRPHAPDPTLHALLTGFQPIVEAGHTVQPELLTVQRVRYDPQTGQVEIEYNTMNDVRLQGSASQPQVQLMLARAMVESDNPALRLHAVKAAGAIALQQQNLDQELLQAFAYLLNKEQNQGVRLMAVRVLRGLPFNEAIKKMLLQIVLSDDNTALRIEAFDELAAHGEGRAIEPYLQTIARDSSSYLQYKARELQETIQAEPVRSAELSQEN
jgi:anti-sigma factor RsiW